MNIMEDDGLRAEDIAEVNELKLQKELLEEIIAEYSPMVEGAFNPHNDRRIVDLVSMILRCGTYNEGLTRIVLE